MQEPFLCGNVLFPSCFYHKRALVFAVFMNNSG
jgi:hypothetical protein